MIQIIQPREYFPISRIIPDPADVNTYYVRAVIRNARTGVSIATVNLALQGSNIYSNTWQAVADSSGKGTYITITTTVYTDAAYTTKSDVYGEDSDTFLIYDRFNAVQQLGNQISAQLEHIGGGDVDYKKIKKIIDASLKDSTAAITQKLDDMESEDEAEELDFTPILSKLNDAIELIKATKKVTEDQEIPDAFDYDKFADVLALLAENLSAKIDEIPEPPEKVDLTPVLDKLNEMSANDVGEDTKQLHDLFEEIKTMMGQDFGKTLNEVESLHKLMYEFIYHSRNAMGAAPTPEAPKEPVQKPQKGPRSELNQFGNVVTREQ